MDSNFIFLFTDVNFTANMNYRYYKMIRKKQPPDFFPPINGNSSKEITGTTTILPEKDDRKYPTKTSQQKQKPS
jgi:hypothetical protein